MLIGFDFGATPHPCFLLTGTTVGDPITGGGGGARDSGGGGAIGSGGGGTSSSGGGGAGSLGGAGGGAYSISEVREERARERSDKLVAQAAREAQQFLRSCTVTLELVKRVR